MVQSSAATSSTAVDSAAVKLKSKSTGINGNGQNTNLSNRLDQLSLIVGRWRSAIGVSNVSLTCVILAHAVGFSLTGNVGIVVPVHDSFVESGVTKGVGLKAAIAAVVVVWIQVDHIRVGALRRVTSAIDQLLCADTSPGVAVLDAGSAESALERGAGSEGPATAATALVLDACDPDIAV